MKYFCFPDDWKSKVRAIKLQEKKVEEKTKYMHKNVLRNWSFSLFCVFHTLFFSFYPSFQRVINTSIKKMCKISIIGWTRRRKALIILKVQSSSASLKVLETKHNSLQFQKKTKILKNKQVIFPTRNPRLLHIEKKKSYTQLRPIS